MQVDSPVREYRTIVDDSGNPGYTNRLMVGTAATGTVRIEWHQARIGQVIPVNWSKVDMYEFVNSYIPLRYQVADAQNLICKEAIEKDFEWLLLYEHDVLPPPDALVRLNQHIRDETVPVVSGLYYTRSRPSEPLVFRGRGTGAYTDFEIGDMVWCDGVPTGYLLIHMGIIRAMWEDSREYTVNKPWGAVKLREIFHTPRDLWADPETGFYNTSQGTSDLQWCTRIMEGGYFEKAGWHEYQDKEHPFLVDTNIFCRHINPNGEQFP